MISALLLAVVLLLLYACRRLNSIARNQVVIGKMLKEWKDRG